MRHTFYLIVLLLVALMIFPSCKKAIKSESFEGEIVSSNLTANEILETAPPINVPKTIAINGNISGFHETLPARYSLTTKKYPLIVFLHGGGELGTGLDRLTCCGIPYYVAKKTFPPKFYYNGTYYSYIIISPQFRQNPSASDIQSVLNYAKSH